MNQKVKVAHTDNPSQSTVPPTGNKFQRWLKTNLLVKLPVAFVIAMIIRTFFLQAFRVETDAAAPEIPRGSHFFVWKLAHHFAPGDLIAYHKGGFVNVGRVASDVGTVIVNRNGEADEPLSRDEIIGKVVSVYWRGSSTRDGAQGMLQISGVTENPPGVKFRYKLCKARPQPL